MVQSVTSFLAQSQPHTFLGHGVPVSGSAAVIEIFSQGVWALGLALGAVLVGRWMIKGPIDPLSNAPHRSHSFTPEVVVTALLAYLVAIVVCGSLLQSIEGMEQSSLPLTGDTVVGSTDFLRPEARGEMTEVDQNQNPDSESANTVKPSLVENMIADAVARLVGAAVCVIVAIRSFSGGLPKFLFGELAWSQWLLWSVVGALIASPMCDLVLGGTVVLIKWLDPAYDFEQHSTLVALSEGVYAWYVVVSLRLSAGLLAPVTEELFFRGLLQTTLLPLVRSRWLILVGVSSVFALAHGQLHFFPALFALSMLLGYSYEKTGCLMIPLLIHMLFNAKTLLMQYLGL